MAEAESIGDIWLDIGRSAARKSRERLLSGNLGKCPSLASGENHCERGNHYLVMDRGEDEFPEELMIRACPIAARRVQAAQRREILESAPHISKIAGRYGLHDWDPERPMWSQLLAAVEDRPVRVAIGQTSQKWHPLSHLIDLVRRGCYSPDADGPNVMFFGPCGTGKTSLQAVRFLAYAEAGIDAVFLDSIDLRTLVGNLNSRFSETAAKAHQELERLTRRAVIFWSDVGDTQATRREFAETLAAFLERFSGKLETSTNLNLPQLCEHPDIGRRALSRMLSSRNGKPALYVTLDGPDQRQHADCEAQEVLAL